MANRYPLHSRPTAIIARGKVPRVFGDNSAAIVPRVVSPDVSDREPDNEPAGQVLDNPVIHQGSHADDERRATADVHSDPEGDIDDTSEMKTPLSDNENENDGGTTHRRVQFHVDTHGGDSTTHHELSKEQADVV